MMVRSKAMYKFKFHKRELNIVEAKMKQRPLSMQKPICKPDESVNYV